MSDKNDYSLLRPLNLAAVAHGAHVCDTRGRTLTIDGATELLEQNGPQALRLAPICWLDGKPVYPDSVLDFGGYTAAARLATHNTLLRAVGRGTAKWPPKKVLRTIEVRVEGEVVHSEKYEVPEGHRVVGVNTIWSHF